MKKDRVIICILSFVMPIIICIALKYLFKGIGYNVCNFNGIEIIKTLLGIWATLLGFIITAASILVTMEGKDYIQAFKNSHHYKTVMWSYCFASFSLLVAIIGGIIITCINTWSEILFYILIYMISSTLIIIFFCVLFLFFMIFKSI